MSVVVATANIAFAAASGAHLKALVSRDDLVQANSRFEATTWTATVIGPPLGGALIGMCGPLMTITANAASYVVSAIAVGTIQRPEPPTPQPGSGSKVAGIAEGWRYILRSPQLRLLFFNTTLVNALIMATAPLMAVLLLLRELGFPPWQYGLAFGVPCLGGLIGSRMAQPLVARFGQRAVLLTSGTGRAVWSLGLALIGPGATGLLTIIMIEFGLITSMGVFNPVFAAYRLEHTDDARIARTLSAWRITGGAAIAILTLVWGFLATSTTTRTALITAGVLVLCTPALLPWRELLRPRGQLLSHQARS